MSKIILSDTEKVMIYAAALQGMLLIEKPREIGDAEYSARHAKDTADYMIKLIESDEQ